MPLKDPGSDMTTTLQLIIFLLASAGIISVSRASLRRPGTHGFYRFWAWEVILALAVLNLPVWFPRRWPGIKSSRGCC